MCIRDSNYIERLKTTEAWIFILNQENKKLIKNIKRRMESVIYKYADGTRQAFQSNTNPSVCILRIFK